MVRQRTDVHLVPLDGLAIVDYSVWLAIRREGFSSSILCSGVRSNVSVLARGRQQRGRRDELAQAVNGADGSSAGILLYGWAVFQKRLTLISTRNPDGFGECCPAVQDVTCEANFRSHLGTHVHLRCALRRYPRQLHLPHSTGQGAHWNQPHVDYECLGPRQPQGRELVGIWDRLSTNLTEHERSLGGTKTAQQSIMG